MNSSILLFGSTGQLGQEIEQKLELMGKNFLALNRDRCNFTQPDCIQDAVMTYKPHIIINCAAYTAVDKAESEKNIANTVNGKALKILAKEAEKINAFIVHISTDYVFDGSKNIPYLESDRVNPINSYGRSKLMGEQELKEYCNRFLILRTSWVYGIYGKGNFVKTMLRLGTERKEIRVVADQIGSPTWTGDLGNIITQMPPSLTGTYHYSNSGVASWYDLAVAIFEEAKSLNFPLKIEKVIPITTAEYPTAAKRPAYSVLSCRKISSTLNIIPPHWRESLRKMLQQLREN
ncbi:MAG: dTDP-4-dehydrorhamnose reductase [Cyanobacteria bacterium SBLK]|nr:dTDP-4-dehydrorhamnose reductase [Cyanobacteria bacterium SBLK]